MRNLLVWRVIFIYNLSSEKMIARYAIDSTHAIEASLSKGFSVPTLQESLTETGSFNTNLKPEEAWQYEIIYSTKPLKWLEASLTAYYIDVQNLIESISSKTKLIWISNPNNPTGTIINDKDFQ